MLPTDSMTYLSALIGAERPGAEKVLAFYDRRVNMICTDARLLLAPLDDHLCHRGDGLFESICYRQGKIFALRAHLERMRSGSQALCIDPPLSWQELGERICDVARAGGEDHGDLRVFLSRGPGGFGISPAECPAPGLYIVALRSRPAAPELYESGLSAFRSRIPPKQEYLAVIKNTNYLPNVFMAREAEERGMDVAITFDGEGYMGEAAIANVAIVDANGVLRSPPPGRILPGTTLLTALALARKRMPVSEAPVHADEIPAAREMLLFTSATLCVPITSFDGRPVDSGRPGPCARWLREELEREMLATGTPFL